MNDGNDIEQQELRGYHQSGYCKANLFSARFFGSMVSNRSHSSGKICSSISALKSIGLLRRGGGFSRMSAAVTYGKFPSSSRFSSVLLVDKKTSKDIPQC